MPVAGFLSRMSKAAASRTTAKLTRRSSLHLTVRDGVVDQGLRGRMLLRGGRAVLAVQLVQPLPRGRPVSRHLKRLAQCVVRNRRHAPTGDRLQRLDDVLVAEIQRYAPGKSGTAHVVMRTVASGRFKLYLDIAHYINRDVQSTI